MGELRENWLTEGLIDFEYKKIYCTCLPQQGEKRLSQNGTLPIPRRPRIPLSQPCHLQRKQSAHQRRLSRRAVAREHPNLELTWNKIIEDDAIMKELESIISFALPEFKSSLDEGAQIYEYVESNCEISPIGLASLYAHEGYLFLSQPPEKETNVYRYQLTFFEGSNESMRGIHMKFLKNNRAYAGKYIRAYQTPADKRVYITAEPVGVPGTFENEISLRADAGTSRKEIIDQATVCGLITSYYRELPGAEESDRYWQALSFSPFALSRRPSVWLRANEVGTKSKNHDRNCERPGEALQKDRRFS